MEINDMNRALKNARIYLKERSELQSVILGFAIVIGITSLSFGQVDKTGTVERKGWAIGVGVGAGTLTLSTNDTVQTNFSTTLPNIKVGYTINEHLALYMLLPGANYKYQNKDRGFEAIQFAGQYWFRDRWWVLGGAGISFDAPAFYTVKDPKTAEFNFGVPAFSVATGYEVWQKEKFALDVQYRIFVGKSSLPEGGVREGFSSMLIVGFNWY